MKKHNESCKQAESETRLEAHVSVVTSRLISSTITRNGQSCNYGCSYD